MDPTITIASWIGLAVFGMVLVTGFITLTLRYLHHRHNSRRDEFRAHWKPIFDGVVVSNGSNLKVPDNLSRKNTVFFAEFWLEYAYQVTDQQLDLLRKVGENFSLLNWAQRNLKSKFQVQILAIQLIGFLEEDWNDQLEALTESDNLYKSIVAFRSLIRINPNRALDLFLPRLVEDYEWSDDQVFSLLELVGSEAVTDPLLDLLESQPSVRKDLVLFLEVCEPEGVLTSLKTWLKNDEHPELVAKYLSLLAYYEDPEGREFALEYHDHESWFVRLQAIRCLRTTGQPNDIEYLKPHLSDPNWWVRYRAAEAILSLSQEGIQSLETLKESITDEYGKEILEYFLSTSSSAQVRAYPR